MMKRQQGFTLIELLVVIAIIGILSSVVLASLNTARDKGEDAAVKSNLNNIRAQAELVYDDDGSYDGVCANANVSRAVSAADGACSDADAGWTATGPLSTGGNYCVDSTGNAATTSGAVPAGDWVEGEDACIEL
jgi:prepilin-type N-terminal cleavage/methylation domain-containing protein